ncbi:MAG: hypothetical protein IJV48_08140 [Ruminococcus sp.]|nr:hypothetical protein [Ruminococcus sp.]
MSIFDNLNQPAPAPTASQKPAEGRFTFVFNALPESVGEMKALPEAALDTPYKTAALTVCALCAYAAAPEIGKEMLNFLKGPAPLSPIEISFLNDRFRDGKHVPFSYFAGATPENNYTPARPFTVTVFSNPYSFQNEGWATLHLNSGGADSPRQIKLRLKPSEGKWYLSEQMIMVGVRTPKAADPWS